MKLLLLGHDHNTVQPSHVSESYEQTILGRLNQHKINYLTPSALGKASDLHEIGNIA